MVWNKLTKLNKQPKITTTPAGGGNLRKPIPEPHLFKYLSLSCLTLAIISTIGLNLARSYSTSNTLANAEQGSSNTTTSTNANASDPASIKLSITPLSTPTSSNCDTSTPSICLDIPDGGGIATGGHTIKIWTNSVAGWELFLTTSNTTSTGSSNTDKSSLINPNAKDKPIYSLPSSATISNATTLSNNTWGVAFPYGFWEQNNYYSQEANYTSSNQATLSKTKWTSSEFINTNMGSTGQSVASCDWASANDPNNDGNGSSVRHIYYGVRVDDPGSMVAGNYTANLTYTATVQLPPTPTITSITPNTYELGSGEDSTVTITGTNLLSTNRVYIETTNNTEIDCTNINVIDDTKLTCQMPADDNSIINPGTYTVYIKTQAERQGKLEKGFEYTRQSICRNADPDSDCQVDIDDNMIPVTYVGYDGNGRGHWAVVGDADIQSNLGSWYNYRSGQWANAVTVQNPRKYTNAATGTEVNNNDVLGYWVYIPRYAYEVQRRDAVDARVSRQNFGIVFQTADEKNAPAPTKSTATNHLDYRTGNGISRTYVANSNNTTWATHPAFIWQYTRAANGFDKTYELNGIWVGKYETTGKRAAPTVKPNQVPVYGEYMGEFYTAAKSIAVNDPNNKGGNPVSGIVQNSHHLVKATSHMLKNSEWGAIVYLANSSYGAGLSTKYNHGYSNVKSNFADGNFSNDDADGGVGSGVTGCGPGDEWRRYGEGTILDATTIESPTACSENLTYAYNGSNGVLSSSTNTVYGVYGIAGGGRPEAVMGNRTTSATQTTNFVDDGKTTDAFLTPATPPYVDLYRSSDGFGVPTSWSSNTSGEYYYNFDVCTFKTCGGTATYEIQNWTSSGFIFVDLGENAMRGPWFERGGDTSYTNTDAVFMATTMTGDKSGTGTTGNYRVALIVN